MIEEIISNLEFGIKKILISFEQGILTQFPSSVDELSSFSENLTVYKENYDKYESSKVTFIIHPSYLEYDRKTIKDKPYFDLALFTDFQKTEKPAYRLFKGQPETLLGKNAIGVGITSAPCNEDIKDVISKKAFNSIIKNLNEHKDRYHSEPFMPSMDHASHNSLEGLITGGDSGGSMLIKNDDDSYYLCGVISGHAENDPLQLKLKLKSIYSNISPELKTSEINQDCEQENSESYCYGTENAWAVLDLDFIDQSVEKLLLQAKQNESKEEL